MTFISHYLHKLALFAAPLAGVWAHKLWLVAAGLAVVLFQQVGVALREMAAAFWGGAKPSVEKFGAAVGERTFGAWATRISWSVASPAKDTEQTEQLMLDLRAALPTRERATSQPL
jgi:hypothetical protein